MFATVKESNWTFESWSREGDAQELRAVYEGFHEDARAVIAAVTSTQKTALYSREPLQHWTRGRVTILGDACHPMLPFMAQGAAMGLEDAAILMRVLKPVSADRDEIVAALGRYEATRIARASRIQNGSAANDWLRVGIDAAWVYGYDALTTPLAGTEATQQ